MGRRSLFVAALCGVLLPAAALVTGASGASSSRVFTAVVAGVPSSVDFANYTGRPSSDLGTSYDSTLVRFKRIPADAKALQGPTAVTGYVAQSWKLNRDGSYTFVLRKNARSAAGNTVSSADVLYSFQRMLAIDSTAKFLFSVIGLDAGNPVKIVNSRTFTLNVSHPSAVTLSVLAYYSVSILDSATVKAHATDSDPWAKSWLDTHSAGFGAYEVSSFTPGASLTLTRNPHFWGRPYFASAVIKAVPDADARLQLVRSGEADYTTDLSFVQMKSLESVKGVTVPHAVDADTDAIALEETFKPFSDARVRQAMWFAVNRSALVKSVYAGFGRPAVETISSVIPREKPVVVGDYNPTKAKALLAAAGYPNGFSFTLTVCPLRPGAYAPQLAQLLQAQLGAVGIQASINVVASLAEFEADRRLHKYDAYLIDSRPVVVDPAYAVALDHRTRPLGLSNFISYSNPKLDNLDSAALGVASGPRRNRNVLQVEKILANDVPWTKLVEAPSHQIFRSEVVGYGPDPSGGFYPEYFSRR